VANDCIPIYEPGGTLTCHATVALTGKRFCAVAAEPLGGAQALVTLQSDGQGGNIQVGMPALNGRVLGVNNRDIPQGGKVGVLTTPGLIVPVTCSAAIAAGQEVSVDADGRIKPAAAGQMAVALCVGGTTTANQDAAVKLYGTPRVV
jgi:predicted RecA/RadA family phage recombinase